ncbi:hypothetical protein ABZP36_019286 [Zizania latifolia]
MPAARRRQARKQPPPPRGLSAGSRPSLTPGLWSQCKAYEDSFVERAKGTISDALVLVNEHQAEVIGCATVAGFIILRGPRRFLYRNTLGRFKTEKDLLNDAEQSMMEYTKSIEHLKKDSKYTLDKIAIGESDLQRGRTDLRSTGKQILSLISSIYKAESTAAGLIDRLQTIPTRQSLELRSEVASMASDLKSQRYVLEERINKISEYGVRV